MKTILRHVLLFTAVSFSGCQLIPDEYADIFKPDPKPTTVCELVELKHESDSPEGSFVIRFDSTGEFNDEVKITTTSLNGDGVDEIKPDYNVATIKFQTRRTPSELANFNREVEVDDQGRLIRDYTTYTAFYPGDIISSTTLYSYAGNKVEAHTTQTFGNDTTITTTTFEYMNDNLTKISSNEGVVNFEYGSTINKLYDLEKGYAGFGVFTPVEPYLTLGAMVPVPSKKLPTKQSIEGESTSLLRYNWTVDSNGYPSKVEVVNTSNETRIYEYGYQNCHNLQ